VFKPRPRNSALKIHLRRVMVFRDGRWDLLEEQVVGSIERAHGRNMGCSGKQIPSTASV